MSAEQLIKRILADAAQQQEHIIKEAKQQAQELLDKKLQQAYLEAETILDKAKQETEHIQRVHSAKAEQHCKKLLMHTKEQLISNCFSEALQHLQQLKGKQYEHILTGFLQQGKQQLGENATVLITRDEDKSHVEHTGFTVKGSCKGTGGIKIQSPDGMSTIDYTFEAIMQRKKPELRIHVGTLLFSETGDHP